MLNFVRLAKTVNFIPKNTVQNMKLVNNAVKKISIGKLSNSAKLKLYTNIKQSFKGGFASLF